MNLEQVQLRIRERRRGEVYDLALVLIRRNARAFAALALAVVTPTALAVIALLRAIDLDSDYLAFVALVLGATVIRAPVTLLAGQAMFSPRPSLRRTLDEVRTLKGRILLDLCLFRLALAFTVVGLVVHGFRRYFLDEVLLLERVDTPSIAPRTTFLRSTFGGASAAHLCAQTLLLGLFLASAWSVRVALVKIFADPGASILATPEGLGDPVIVVSFLAAQVYFAVAKFLFYLDLRTRHEGWDLFLATRKLRQDLERRRRRFEPERRGSRAAAGAAVVSLAAAVAVAAVLALPGAAVAGDDGPRLRPRTGSGPGEVQAPGEATGLAAGAAEPGEAERAREEVRGALVAGDYPWYDAGLDDPAWERLVEGLEVPEIDQPNPWLALMLNVLALYTLLGVGLYLWRRHMKEGGRRDGDREREEEPVSTPAIVDHPARLDPDQHPDAWLHAARLAADRGDFALAIVHLFNHELVVLSRTGRIHLLPGRTNAQYLRELPRGSRERAGFRESIRIFEAVFYGGRPADAETYRRFAAGCERLTGLASEEAA